MKIINGEQFEAHLQTELQRAQAAGHLDALLQVQRGIQIIFDTDSELTRRTRITEFLNTAIVSAKQTASYAYAQDGL